MIIFFEQLVKESLMLTVYISAPTVIGCAAVGITVAIIQSATQVQEQSISFLSKLLVSVVMMFIFGEWGGRLLGSFFMKIINDIPYLSESLK